MDILFLLTIIALFALMLMAVEGIDRL